MTWLADSVFLRGSTHHVCQDYALHGVIPGTERPFVVLADGCSSSIRTEIGSMLLCKIVENYFTVPATTNFEDVVDRGIQNLIEFFHFDRRNFDCTLLVAWVTHEDKLKIKIYGDGTYVWTNGEASVVTNYEYSNNAPYYLNYEFTEKDRLECAGFYNGATLKKTSFGLQNPEQKSVEIYHPQTRSTMEMEMASGQSVFLFSDGISSFVGDDIWTLERALENMTSFPLVAPGCLDRRVKREVRQREKKGVYHQDDLSVAMIMKL